MAKKVKKTLKKILPQTEIAKDKAEKVKRTKIRVIGIGGGGGNIVSELAQRVQRATFVAVNTDLKALKEVSRNVEKIQLGKDTTHGFGTGMNPELGEMVAQNEKDKIKKILQGQDLVILIASLGGGVGSGVSPVFAQISKNLGNITYGIFTLPFKFEGERKMEIAKYTLERIKPKLNALTIIPNERIFQIINKDTPLKQALSEINKNLAESLEGLIETIYEPGLINIDFADLRTIFEGRGRLCYLNTISFPKKEGQIKEIIEKALNSLFCPYGIRGAKAILYNIVGEKGFNLEEVNEISKAISEKANREAKIIFGIAEGKGTEGNIKITILATGVSNYNQYIGKEPRITKKTVKKALFEKFKKEKLFKKKKIKKGRKTIPPKKRQFSKKAKRVKRKKKIKKIKKEKELISELPPQVEDLGEEFKKENLPLLKSIKIRKNGLQLKKETEEVEKEIIEKEKFWETPAFLRKRFKIQ